MPAEREVTLDDLLDFVKQSRGFDFTGYKRSSIERRVSKRMQEVGVGRYEDYIDYLQLNAGEYAELFNTLLINTTAFFRDPQAWEVLAGDVVPSLIAARPPDSPLRIWSAGCASGEEAYTVAMVFARVLGDAAFRERVKIYATDVDEDALDTARHGAYLPRQIEDVPRDALERFFEQTDQRFVFRKDLRRSVIFGRNDLVQDAPISHIDLLVCRNTLMYFMADTQAQILRRFHFALDDDGVLLLGKSEMLMTHSDLFTPIDLKSRVFHKVMRPSRRDRGRVIPFDPGNGASRSVGENLREAAFDMSNAAQVVLDANGVVVMANDLARRTFGIGLSDFGRPIQDLELSYRPVELRTHLDALIKGMRAIELKTVQVGEGDRERVMNVRIAPLLAEGVLMGTSISYVDVTDIRKLETQVTSAKRELEVAYEELQSTVEELETTNEELQSSNEELETTNEELHSSNEELETMNEELQSSNEELQTMNEELRHRTVEVDQMNSFLETILTTIGLAVLVVDKRQHIQIWNGQARELWGLTAGEVEDQHLQSIDIGLPVESLKRRLRDTLAGKSSQEQILLEATNRRGKPFQCRVTLLPMTNDGEGTVSGVIMMMEPAPD